MDEPLIEIDRYGTVVTDENLLRLTREIIALGQAVGASDRQVLSTIWDAYGFHEETPILPEFDRMMEARLLDVSDLSDPDVQFFVAALSNGERMPRLGHLIARVYAVTQCQDVRERIEASCPAHIYRSGTG